jgi:hypothetical protein
MTPGWGRAALTWTVFIVLVSGTGLLVGRPGSAGFVLSGLMLAVGVLFGVVLLVLLRTASARDAGPDDEGR